MGKEYDLICEILIELTDTMGYDEKNEVHRDAFFKARRRLEDLIDEIDNAERV